MNVFMPYPDLRKSVECLDPRRLGNQVYREGLTLIRGGWSRHPAALIWADHKRALTQYCLFGLEELERRGRFYPHHKEAFQKYLLEFADTGLPDIVKDDRFCARHRAALLFKDFDYYKRFGWTEEPKIEYIWR